MQSVVTYLKKTITIKLVRKWRDDNSGGWATNYYGRI